MRCAWPRTIHANVKHNTASLCIVSITEIQYTQIKFQRSRLVLTQVLRRWVAVRETYRHLAPPAAISEIDIQCFIVGAISIKNRPLHLLATSRLGVFNVSRRELSAYDVTVECVKAF